ncbi:MAG: hypothetical protein ACRD2E_00165 [Terriglobales bacterium]
MHSRTNQLLATLTMLVAMCFFAAMTPAWAQNTGQQGQQGQQQAQPNQGQQQQPGAQPSAQAGQQDQGMASGTVSATGCLQSSGAGQYSLTDQATNQTWTLTSSNVDLSKHVDHTVTVTGTASNAGAAGTPAGQAGGQQSLDVQKIKTVSSSCSSGGSTPPSLF